MMMLPTYLIDADIWAIDQCIIRETIQQRNALRQSAWLPLLDEQKEFDHACTVLRQARWTAFWNDHISERERFVAEVIAVRGRPTGWCHAAGNCAETDRQFRAYLRATYPSEIAALNHITPDYLAITRNVTNEH